MSGDSIPLAVNRDSGFIPDPFDAKDHYYQAEDSTRPQLSVNLRKTHAPNVSGVYNQGQTGSCTANAVAAAFWYEEKAGRRAKAWGSAGPSRLFIYWNARGGYKNDSHDIKHVSDEGSQGRAAIKGLAKVGACSEADCPFVDFDGIKSKLKKTKLKGNALDEAVEEEIKKAVNTKPSDNAFRNATPHKITSYYRLDPQRPDKDVKSLTKEQKDQIGSSLLENLRKCLTEGFPVTFGFWFYLPDDDDDDAFDTTKKPFVLRDVWHRGVDSFPRHTFPHDLPPERRITDTDGKLRKPGHSVLAIGYDDERQQVLVQNSWGAHWSGNGTFWMPYAWITDFAATNDFWTIRTTEDPPDQKPKLWQEVHQEILAGA
ncbi:MAG: hypothetical protein HETSPECPRED_001047 [Heterodermia speciosa]|uniref:Peptidase C1A papain C-terminal domain-containing protein n=1 Tax=Heterodermia speciosa TaxID=116794 RepID=A0A8H3G8A3_9LECA|nr:MAG: hypothetical protein HETSPECPRED_001047 [Heterodermia speciosa]